MDELLYVLDLDDTLYLERDFVRSGYQAVNQFLKHNIGIDGFFDFAWEQFCQKNHNNIINRFLDEKTQNLNDKTKLTTKLIDIYRTHRPNILLCPDADMFLKEKPAHSLALITDGYSQTQWNKIDALELLPKIGNIVVTGDWGNEFWKPHHRAFNFVSQNRTLRNCIYVGDNPQKDFIAPRELGWNQSIRIRRPNSMHVTIDTPIFCREIFLLTEIESQ